MIYRIVKLEIQEGKEEAFQNLFADAKKVIKSRPGCLEVNLHRVSGENIFFTLSVWENEEDLERYRESPYFKALWPEVKQLFAAKAEAWSTSKL